LAGIVILSLWLAAAHDRGYGKNKRCRGCIRYIHTELKTVTNSPTLPKIWTRRNRNPYIYIVIFASILCAAWLGVGTIGFISSSLGGYRIVFSLYYLSTS